ncbi:MAG: hypothetical protein LQ349_008116 [Xanthoria aureola]|nr:MAG: hypothetical protein LQ349_008116 [Xanthoria aureola]
MVVQYSHSIIELQASGSACGMPMHATKLKNVFLKAFRKQFAFGKKRVDDGTFPDRVSLHNCDGNKDATRGAEASNQDPLGLKIIHKPAGDPRVDIVFVHGLGGGSRTTWSKNHNPEFFWPLKFLPFEPDINEARILTFGYNANFRRGSGKNKMSVLDFAKDLLYDLKYAKDESVPELEDLRMGEASTERACQHVQHN